MITWDAVIFALGFTAITVLFLGPAMWSSSTDSVFTTLWRKLFGGKKPGGGGGEDRGDRR